MVMNDRLTSLSFHVNQPPHSSNKAISNFDLETTRSRSWVWSKGKTILSAQYLIDLLFVLHQTENNSWDTTVLKFDLEKSKVKVRGEVKARGHIVHPVSNRSTSFCFTSIGPTFSEICPMECLTLKKHIRKFQSKFGKKKRNSSKI